MITKAIIVKMISKYQARVRIPIYDKDVTSATATPNEDLAIATICVMPGSYPNYQAGDVVFLEFEDNIMSHPVIIGLLYRDGSYTTSSDLIIDNITVNNSTKLSDKTTVGDVTYKEIATLEGSKGSIQNQIDVINSPESGGGGSGKLVLTIDENDSHKLIVST